MPLPYIKMVKLKRECNKKFSCIINFPHLWSTKIHLWKYYKIKLGLRTLCEILCTYMTKNYKLYFICKSSSEHGSEANAVWFPCMGGRRNLFGRHRRITQCRTQVSQSLHYMVSTSSSFSLPHMPHFPPPPLFDFFDDALNWNRSLLEWEEHEKAKSMRFTKLKIIMFETKSFLWTCH